ncbi:hypothetical protein PRO82_000253 [Candidatus Protochlamydia amoebophila]|nr:hypothetical protein [Candidatus Protochlamydia amoebophila]
MLKGRINELFLNWLVLKFENLMQQFADKQRKPFTKLCIFRMI